MRRLASVKRVLNGCDGSMDYPASRAGIRAWSPMVNGQSEAGCPSCYLQRSRSAGVDRQEDYFWNFLPAAGKRCRILRTGRTQGQSPIPTPALPLKGREMADLPLKREKIAALGARAVRACRAPGRGRSGLAGPGGLGLAADRQPAVEIEVLKQSDLLLGGDHFEILGGYPTLTVRREDREERHGD